LRSRRGDACPNCARRRAELSFDLHMRAPSPLWQGRTQSSARTTSASAARRHRCFFGFWRPQLLIGVANHHRWRRPLPTSAASAVVLPTAAALFTAMPWPAGSTTVRAVAARTMRSDGSVGGRRRPCAALPRLSAHARCTHDTFVHRSVLRAPGAHHAHAHALPPQPCARSSPGRALQRPVSHDQTNDAYKRASRRGVHGSEA